jgi:hypothetical protein
MLPPLFFTIHLPMILNVPPSLLRLLGRLLFPLHQAFTEWCDGIDDEFIVKKITIQSFDMFGPRMGFVKFVSDVTDKEGRQIPSIVFMRGASVGMLIVITCEEDKTQHTILTVQPRVPCGKYALEELPAGMLDQSGSFIGAAAKELEEETGLKVKEKELIDLTEKAFKGTKYAHVYPSAGGSDEILRLFLYQVQGHRGSVTSRWGVEESRGVERNKTAPRALARPSGVRALDASRPKGVMPCSVP